MRSTIRAAVLLGLLLLGPGVAPVACVPCVSGAAEPAAPCGPSPSVPASEATEGPPIRTCPPLPEGIRRAMEVRPSPRSGFPAPFPEANRRGALGNFERARGIAAGGILPHHDVAGPLILRFYEVLRASNSPPRRVILIGPDHFRAGRGPVSLCGADWETPFGPLSADPAAATLVSSGLALRQDGIFPGEHGMTVHLPLIRRFFPGASVLPLILRGNVSDLQLLALRKFLLPLAREGGLVLLSMDLSHRKLPPEAAREDDRTLPVLLGLRPRSLTGLDLDCPRGAALFLSLMKELGADDPTLLERSDSGTLSGRLGEPCTSYATILYRFR